MVDLNLYYHIWVTACECLGQFRCNYLGQLLILGGSIGRFWVGQLVANGWVNSSAIEHFGGVSLDSSGQRNAARWFQSSHLYSSDVEKSRSGT